MAHAASGMDAFTLGSWGMLVSSTAADNTPPDPPTLSLASVTTTTATFNLTAPSDADYDHCDLYYQKDGEAAPTQLTPFTGSLTGLTAGAMYEAVAFAYDASGNRSGPSKVIRFRTISALSGTYNYKVWYRTDEGSWTAEAITQLHDITKDRSRTSVKLRGERGQFRITMSEVNQDLILIGYRLDGEVLARRAD